MGKRKWEAMDEEEKRIQRLGFYIPAEFKKNIIHALGMKYDAGKS